MYSAGRSKLYNFNPRAPRGARPLCSLSSGASSIISIHVPREGHDNDGRFVNVASFTFQSTCPARGTTESKAGRTFITCISIHVPREGHDSETIYEFRTSRLFQSTCPARGTTFGSGQHKKHPGISIHVPREGHDVYADTDSVYFVGFQSTCPARGTTLPIIDSFRFAEHFNPRAPRGARRVQVPNPNMARGISIHVPREGHDDWCNWERLGVRAYFNPRAPRGARPLSALKGRSPRHFNPRAPRGARLYDTGEGVALNVTISIHVPREGHDVPQENFHNMQYISIHVPREGHDIKFFSI